MDDIPAIAVRATDLAERLCRLCPTQGLDLAGAVALTGPPPLAGRFSAWLAEGRHGDLEYMIGDARDRLDPRRRRPWARSVLVFGQRYGDGWASRDPDPVAGGAGRRVPWTARVARYARGLDYHDLLLADLRAVLNGLAADWPQLAVHAAVDTGPFLEREYAWLAGLGFLGKNTCLIHERLGSGLFLGVALTNLEIAGLPPAGVPAVGPLYAVTDRRARPQPAGLLSACGSCTRCIEACPTGALGPDGGLDAGRCLATWTIERQGRAPADDRARQGGLLFGCDICQAVCPWNRRAAGRDQPPPRRPGYESLPEHGELDLAALIGLGDDEFRRRFRRTPLWRAHPAGLRRNALIVAGNGAGDDLDRAVAAACGDPDPETAAVARWARAWRARSGGSDEGES